MECIEDEHAQTNFTRDPLTFCQLQGIDYVIGPRSLARASRYQDDGPDLIVVSPEGYGSRDLFTISHEIAHVIARREGYIKAIKRHHACVPNMRQHIEALMNHAAGLLLMPAPDLRAAYELFGETPRAIAHLAELSGASHGAAMRRWSWQDVAEARGAFLARERLILDVTACRMRMPFKRDDRVPEIHIAHPDISLLALPDGRLLGVVGW